MAVTIAYTAQLKLALGVSREDLEISTPCTVEQLLDALVDRHGRALSQLLCGTDGNAGRAVLVCVGDQQVCPGDDATIRAGDTVTLLAPISGG